MADLAEVSAVSCAVCCAACPSAAPSSAHMTRWAISCAARLACLESGREVAWGSLSASSR